MAAEKNEHGNNLSCHEMKAEGLIIAGAYLPRGRKTLKQWMSLVYFD